MCQPHIDHFYRSYQSIAGEPLTQPVFWGLQLLVDGGVIFSNVPDKVKQDIENGRDGIDIAQRTLGQLEEVGIKRIYLIPPILKGGRRDYETAARFLRQVRQR